MLRTEEAKRWNDRPINERLKITYAACCSNPNPILSSDHRGKPIVMCANCGART